MLFFFSDQHRWRFRVVLRCHLFLVWEPCSLSKGIIPGWRPISQRKEKQQCCSDSLLEPVCLDPGASWPPPLCDARPMSLSELAPCLPWGPPHIPVSCRACRSVLGICHTSRNRGPVCHRLWAMGGHCVSEGASLLSSLLPSITPWSSSWTHTSPCHSNPYFLPSRSHWHVLTPRRHLALLLCPICVSIHALL